MGTLRLFDIDPTAFGTDAGFCSQTTDIFQFVGYIVLVIKILIPVILVVMGMLALGKAVISDEDKAVGDAVKKLVVKFIIGVCIFFVPSIVKALFSIVSGFSDVEPDYMICINCITSPKSGC